MFDIKIIGVNEYADEKATIAELSVLDGYVTADFEAAGLGLILDFQGDGVEFSDNSKKNYGTLTKVGKIPLYPTTYNDIGSAVTFDTQYPLAPILNTSYIYIYCQAYNIEFGVTDEALNCFINSVSPNYIGDGNQVASLEIEYELNRNI